MTNKRIIVLNANTEQELVELMENCKEDIYATQPMQKIDGTWVCFVYFHSKQDKMLSSYQTSPILQNELPPKKPFSGKIKYPNAKATESQIETVRKIAIRKKMIAPMNLTRAEASKFIEENGK